MSLGYRKSSLEDERVQIPRHRATDAFPARPLSAAQLSTTFDGSPGLGYRIESAWSPVRVRPLAPIAKVAQW